MRREKLLEAKLKTKILSMITSQVLILTSCCLFKLHFWKLLASPRSTTKV